MNADTRSKTKELKDRPRRRPLRRSEERDLEHGYEPVGMMTPTRDRKYHTHENDTPRTAPMSRSPSRSSRSSKSPRNRGGITSSPSRNNGISLFEASSEENDQGQSSPPPRPHQDKKLQSQKAKEAAEKDNKCKEEQEGHDKMRSPSPSREILREEVRKIWSAHRHSSGRVYYYNRLTKKSTWKKPENY